MRYERIRNLSEQDKSLASPELEGLRTVWRERKQSIAARGSLDSFLTKLKREWAIETGIIERLYHWDRGVTEVLIQQGIDAAVIAHRAGTSETKALHIKDLIDDQESTIDALFAFVKEETSRKREVRREQHIDQILSAAVSALKRQRDAHMADMAQVFEAAKQIETEAFERMEGLAEKCRNDEYKSRYYFQEIVEIARTLGYFANTNIYRSWVSLVIRTREPFYFLISFHGLGHELDYAEPIASTRQRFERWLEDAITIAMAEWQRSVSV